MARSYAIKLPKPESNKQKKHSDKETKKEENKPIQ